MRPVSARPFAFSIVAGTQFIVLTFVAMLLFSGTPRAGGGDGYSFFRNFLSELGMTVTFDGTPNMPSTVLFVIALSVAGLGLISYFTAAGLAYAGSRVARLTGVAGAGFGTLSGIAFIGIAWTPANLTLGVHGIFVNAAFIAFLIAVLLHLVATLTTPAADNRIAVVFGVFALLLAAYLVLLFQDHLYETAEGLILQATGQKIIAYSAIICMIVPAYLMKRRILRHKRS